MARDHGIDRRHAQMTIRISDIGKRIDVFVYSRHGAGGHKRQRLSAFPPDKTAFDFSEERYRKVAERNLNFVLESQNPDGSWYYRYGWPEVGFGRSFCLPALMLECALAKIEALREISNARAAIRRGLEYYVKKFVDDRVCRSPSLVNLE